MKAPRTSAAAAFASSLVLVSATGAASVSSNDSIAHPQSIAAVPAVVAGTTAGAELSKGEPTTPCADAQSIRWYAVKAPRRAAMVATLKAGGELDGAIVVYRARRSHRSEIVCDRTNIHGKAVVAWYGYRDGVYLIGIARRAGSLDGPFRLTLDAAEPAAVPPGDALPTGGVHSTVDPILDDTDAWAARMEAGTTYRINLTSPGNCLALDIYRPNTYRFRLARPVRSHTCGGYSLFTPGVDGGGVYSFVVRAPGTKPVRHSYWLRLAPNDVDDGGPGIKLANGDAVRGDLFGRGVDKVDLYRFSVPHPDELTTIDLQQKPSLGFDLLLVHEDGTRVTCACDSGGRQVLREHLAPGRYFVAVRSSDEAAGKYGLQVLTREVTTTSMTANGSSFAEVPPATAVSLAVQVTSASHGGRVDLEIDRLDPLIGWQFSRVVAASVDESGALVTDWTPPSVGYWRARARFVGTRFSTFSESGYVRIHVAEPLE